MESSSIKRRPDSEEADSIRSSPCVPAHAVISDNDSVGGTPSEGVNVASSSFPSVKNKGLIKPVGL